MKDVFLSHCWKNGCHEFAIALSSELARRHWDVWLDENEMRGNINACMASGIENSKVVAVLVTKEYADKVSIAALEETSDNCMRELVYAFKLQKVILPIILDKSMLETTSWPTGAFSFLMSDILFIDASHRNERSACDSIESALRQRGIHPKRDLKRSQVKSLHGKCETSLFL